MERKTAKPRITELLSDHFSDTWKLLSETSWFLSRTPIFANYENELRSWRRDLQNAEKGGQEHTRIRQEITYLRKSLREQGYDLGLARQNLIMEGFRNDASLGEGFRRVVIFFGDDDIYWLSGEDNHIILAELLERQMEAHSAKRRSIIRSRHYLWYRRRGNDLVLAGADTETKEDYERLKAMAEANSLVLLAKLRGLK
jgi:plasmid stabilization system protein ParE